MALDRDAGFDDGSDYWGEIHTTLQLDCIAAAFLHQPSGIDNGIPDTCVVTHKGHISDYHGPFASAYHRLDVVDHHLQRDRYGAVQTQDHHTQRVSDQRNINAGLVCHQPERIVVGSYHDQLPTVFFCLNDVQYAHFAIGHRSPPL